MELELQLRELIFALARMIDGGETASVIKVETAVLSKDALSIIASRITQTSMSVPGSDTTGINQALYDMMIGEYNSAQPGRSASKWGIASNGLSFLICLCCEILTKDLGNKPGNQFVTARPE